MRTLFLVPLAALLINCTAVQTRVIADVAVTKPDGAVEKLQAEALESHDLGALAGWCLLTGLFYGGACWGYLAAPWDGQERAAMDNARAELLAIASCVAVSNVRVETAGWQNASRSMSVRQGSKAVSRADIERMCERTIPADAPAEVKSAAAAKVAGIERRFDRFKNMTGLRAPLTISRGAPSEVILHMTIGAHAAFAGEVPSGGAAYTLAFVFGFPDWHYLKCHDVDMLVDGAALDLPPSVHNGNVVDGGVAESVTVTIAEPTMARLAAAKRIEFRICRDEMEFDEQSIARLRALHAAAQPPEPVPPS